MDEPGCTLLSLNSARYDLNFSVSRQAAHVATFLHPLQITALRAPQSKPWQGHFESPASCELISIRPFGRIAVERFTWGACSTPSPDEASHSNSCCQDRLNVVSPQKGCWLRKVRAPARSTTGM